MKSRVAIALLFLGLVGLHAVRAGDEDEEGAAPAKKAAKAPAAKSAAPPGDYTPEGLPPLPVQPLSSDAAALVDDDTLFAKFQPKTVTGKETVAELTQSLAKAQTFLKKMRRDLEGEKVWTKNVYDIIQNYQYKYLKTIKDVKMRTHKVKKMAKLVKLIKQSALHAGVKRELSRASNALDELVSRAPHGRGGSEYRRLARKMARLQKALALMPRAEHLFSDTTEKVKEVLASDVSPDSSDALKELVNGKKKKKAKPAPTPAPVTKKPAVAVKPKKAPKKAAAKKGKGKKANKPKKAKKAKKAKKPKKAPKKKAVEEF